MIFTAVLHLFIEHGAEDDVGILVRGALNDGACFLHFGELERSGSSDVDEDAASAVDGSSFEQRRGDGFLRGFGGATRAIGRGSSHDRVAHSSHDRFHVGEVAVDDSRES